MLTKAAKPGGLLEKARAPAGAQLIRAVLQAQGPRTDRAGQGPPLGCVLPTGKGTGSQAIEGGAVPPGWLARPVPHASNTGDLNMLNNSACALCRQAEGLRIPGPFAAEVRA